LREAVSIFDDKINRYGLRKLMAQVPLVEEFAKESCLMEFAKDILGEDAKPVRSVYFDKVPEANWSVAWHQDTSIALKSKHDLPGFGPWSDKDGVVHAEPPEAYLENTLTVRVHLDPAHSDNGVLRVISGSHHSGRVRSSEILEIVEHSTVIECDASPGDVLLMSPLLFHSSRKAINPSHRRVVHIEYSSMTLPDPLEWYECA